MELDFDAATHSIDGVIQSVIHLETHVILPNAF